MYQCVLSRSQLSDAGHDILELCGGKWQLLWNTGLTRIVLFQESTAGKSCTQLHMNHLDPCLLMQAHDQQPGAWSPTHQEHPYLHCSTNRINTLCLLRQKAFWKSHSARVKEFNISFISQPSNSVNTEFHLPRIIVTQGSYCQQSKKKHLVSREGRFQFRCILWVIWLPYLTQWRTAAFTVKY